MFYLPTFQMANLRTEVQVRKNTILGAILLWYFTSRFYLFDEPGHGFRGVRGGLSETIIESRKKGEWGE